MIATADKTELLQKLIGFAMKFMADTYDPANPARPIVLADGHEYSGRQVATLPKNLTNLRWTGKSIPDNTLRGFIEPLVENGTPVAISTRYSTNSHLMVVLERK